MPRPLAAPPPADSSNPSTSPPDLALVPQRSPVHRGEPAAGGELAYRVDFRADDRDPLQHRLNALYGYEHDLATKLLHRSRLNRFFLLMQELIGNGTIAAFDSALDVGSNAGYYSKLISDFGFRHVHGIDIDEGAVATAQKAFEVAESDRSIEFQVQNAEELDASRRYDFVLCTEVIEHTQHPERVIENIARVLAPNGVAVITLPNAMSFPYLSANLCYRLKRRPKDALFEQHLQFPFHRSMRLFDGHPLRVVKTAGANLLMDDIVRRAVWGRPWFAAFNSADFQLAGIAPFKFAAQFFFVAFKNDAAGSVRPGVALRSSELRPTPRAKAA